VITITEIPGTATVRLASGRAAIAVVKDKMQPGEIVEIRTPNAVVAVRGTVVIAEVEPIVDGYRSTITILKGLVDVTKLDGAGRLIGPAVDVKMLERIVVTSKPLATPEKITKQAGEALAAQFSFVPQDGPAASTEALTAQAKETAINDAVQAVGGTVLDPRATANAGSTSGTSATPTTTTTNTTSGGGSTSPSVAGTVSTTTSTLGSTVGTVSNTAGTAVTTVAAPVTTTVSTVTTTLTNTINTVVPTVTSTVTATVPVTAPVVTPVVNILTPVVNTVTTTLTTVTSPAAPTIPSTGGLLSGLGLGKK